MPVRVRYIPQEGKDDTTHQVVFDKDGYQWEMSPNETKVLGDENQTIAANATVAGWATTQQSYAPRIKADDLHQTGRS